jgi:hypothetical protein
VKFGQKFANQGVIRESCLCNSRIFMPDSLNQDKILDVLEKNFEVFPYFLEDFCRKQSILKHSFQPQSKNMEAPGET